MTLRTGRPVRFEYSRKEEFVSARTRHPFRVRVKLGAKDDGMIHAIEMECTAPMTQYQMIAKSLTIARLKAATVPAIPKTTQTSTWTMTNSPKFICSGLS